MTIESSTARTRPRGEWGPGEGGMARRISVQNRSEQAVAQQLRASFPTATNSGNASPGPGGGAPAKLARWLCTELFTISVEKKFLGTAAPVPLRNEKSLRACL